MSADLQGSKNRNSMPNGLLKPPVGEELPKEPENLLGTRPPGSSPVGAIALLRRTVLLSFVNLGTLLRIALYAGVVGVGLSLLLCCPAGVLLKGHPEAWRWGAGLLVMPILIPLFEGYHFVVLRLAVGYKVRVKEVLRPFAKRTAYFNVLAAAGVPYLSLLLLVMAMSHWVPSIGLGAQANSGSGFLVPWLQAMGRSVPWLLLLPFAFAGIETLARRRGWLEGLASSVRFLVRHPALFAGYAGLRFALLLLSVALVTWSSLLLRSPRAEVGTGLALPLWQAFLVVAAFLVASAVVYGITAVGHALFYREFVWRERGGPGSAA